jgi:hypothetical protein
MRHGRQFGRLGRFFGPEGCRRKFLRFFPGGFRDPTYISWEREYKWNAHLRWMECLDAPQMLALIESGKHRFVLDSIAPPSKPAPLQSFIWYRDQANTNRHAGSG